MPYLFTSESVSEGHPDKVADQISDALIDYFLAYDRSNPGLQNQICCIAVRASSTWNLNK